MSSTSVSKRDNLSGQATQEGQDIPRAVGQPETDTAPFVSLRDQAGERQAPHVLAGCPELDLQFLGNIPQTEIGM
jgi:hypothetical protein